MERGFRKRLSPARRVIAEILYHAQRVPLLSTGRRIDVREAARLRGGISWNALFIKAYAMAAAEHEELRTAYIRWPLPHLYVHPHSTVVVMVEREIDGETAPWTAKILAPEKQPLTKIAGHLRRFREAPFLELSDFRQMHRVGRMPGFLRRLVFLQSLHWSGAKRAKRFGTTTVSSVGNLGAEQFTPRTPLTTYFSFGPVENGYAKIKIVYDHRVTDDANIARALQAVERIMASQITAELAGLAGSAAA